MKSLKFRIQPLLDIEGDTVSGPMSPLLFAKEMCEQTESKFNRLARVHFDDDTIFQCMEGDGLTGHDILLIAAVYATDVRLELWVDMGVRGLPVVMGHRSDRKIDITPIYEKSQFERKLTTSEIHHLFSAIFADVSQLKKPTDK